MRENGRLLIHNASVYSPEDAFATAMLIDSGRIAWVGGQGAVHAFADEVDQLIDARGALITPAFVDAHVHLTSAGLADVSIDLSACTSRDEVLAAVRAHTEASRGQGLVLGHGWDETGWPDPTAPSRTELDRAAYGGAVLLQRVDVHSCVASSSLRAAFPEIAGLPGFDPDGALRMQAGHRLRSAVLNDLSDDMRAAAQRAALQRAARLGIACVHEMAGAAVSSESDVTCAQSFGATEPEVLTYWADPRSVNRVDDWNLTGAGGDLFVDGTMGSATAYLREPYLEGGTGSHYLDAEQVAHQLVLATQAGVQTGFHVIGDCGIDVVLAGFDLAAQHVGEAALAAAQHRLEHLEMVHPEHLAPLAHWSVTASVQPVFDALWGGPQGMYSRRIGDRWRLMNPLADMVKAGIPLAFGSDAPVTPMGPWETIQAAAYHRNTEQRISVRAAFGAHTRGGWRAARREGGTLRVGGPATFAMWEVGELLVQAPDDRVAAWSTDPRSGTPGLPDVTPGSDLPRCLWTVRDGVTIYQADGQ